MKSIDNIKRSVKRVLTRLTLIVMVIVFGAMAIAEAQRQRAAGEHVPGNGVAEVPSPNKLQDGFGARAVPDLDQDRGRPTETGTARGGPPQTGTAMASIDSAGADTSRVVYRDSQVIPVAVEEDATNRFTDLLAANEPQTDEAAALRRNNPFRRQGGDLSAVAAQPPADIMPPPLESVGDAYPIDAQDFPPAISSEGFEDRIETTAPPADPAYRPQPSVGAGRFGDTLPAAEADGYLPDDGEITPLGDGTSRDDISGAAPRNRPSGGRFGGALQANGGAVLEEPPVLQREPLIDAAPRAGDGPGRFSPPKTSAFAEGDDAAFGANDEAPPIGAEATIQTPEKLPPAREEFQSAPRGGAFAGDRQVPAAATGQTGAGTPGPTQIEGLQTPTLTIQKIAPPRMAVGQPCSFQIKIHNIGRTIAQNVLVRDEIPQGAELIDSRPPAQQTSDGAIMWQIGALGAGDETTITVDLKPTVEGEIGSVATVAFQTSTSARGQVTRPMLEVVHTSPQTVLVGEPVRFKITLSNPGTGEASGVVLEEDVPSGLSHVSGQQLEYEVGNIPPGGSRQLELTLQAAEPGTVQNILVARAEGGLYAEHRLQMEVVAPKLHVRIDGPRQRYLERPATFTVAIENPGTAPARNVELSTRLPHGLKFVNANNSGHYDSTAHTIRWSLAQLSAGQYGKVQFTAMPMEMGSFPIQAETKAEKGLADTKEHLLQVDGISALLFTLEDKVDPIEVGGETVYEIRVRNQGSKAANGVRFEALVPEGMRPVKAQGPTTYEIQGNRVVFGEIKQLLPKEESKFEIQVQGTAIGDQRFRVAMTSDEITKPVIKEESTKVYSDR